MNHAESLSVDGSLVGDRIRRAPGIEFRLIAWAQLLLLALFATQMQAQMPSMLDPTVTQVASGYGHTCALSAAAAVKCWGSNQYGQLGNTTNSGSYPANPAPLPVTGLGSGVVAIAAGSFHTCALTTAGALKCWGWNLHGELGNPINSSTHDPNPAPLDVTGFAYATRSVTIGRTPVAPPMGSIAGGSNHTCGLTTAGAVKCWGYNYLGQLGNPTYSGTGAAHPAPLDVTTLGSGVVAIAAGDTKPVR